MSGCLCWFFNVWVCLCVAFVMCVCMFGFCNVLVCVFVGFLMYGFVYVGVF